MTPTSPFTTWPGKCIAVIRARLNGGSNVDNHEAEEDGIRDVGVVVCCSLVGRKAQVPEVTVSKDSPAGPVASPKSTLCWVQGPKPTSSCFSLQAPIPPALEHQQIGPVGFCACPRHVMLGLYLRPERTGADYNDVHAVEGQLAELKQEILKYKDHLALLLWGIGNEVDLHTNTRVWIPWRPWPSSFTRWILIIPPRRCSPASIRPKSTWSNPLPQCRCAWGQRYGSIAKLPLNIRRFEGNLRRHGVGGQRPI